MPIAQYEHKCSQCAQTYKVDQSWIDPQRYTNPSVATMTSTFWCPRCEKGQAVKLCMLPNQEIKVVEELVYGSIMNERSPSYYSSNKSNDESSEKIETMTQEKALEILSGLT